MGELLLICTIIMTYRANNIWCTFDVNKNIVTRKFLTQKIANEITVHDNRILYWPQRKV